MNPRHSGYELDRKGSNNVDVSGLPIDNITMTEDDCYPMSARADRCQVVGLQAGFRKPTMRPGLPALIAITECGGRDQFFDAVRCMLQQARNG